MADWWKDQAWPWIKKNWWAVLLAPLSLIIFILMFFARGRTGVVLDPLREADERAREEAEVRARLLEKEKADLAKKIGELEAVNRANQEHFERRVEEEIESLREDPERLRELMLRTGPGRQKKKGG